MIFIWTKLSTFNILGEFCTPRALSVIGDCAKSALGVFFEYATK
jgi:hypothetical protein